MDRTEKIARAMDIICKSLRSHLEYTYGEVGGARRKMGETNAFHRKCVREYAEALRLLSEVL